MKLTIRILVFIFLVIEFSSCDRVRRKTEQVTFRVKEKAKEQLEKQTRKVADKVFPLFDSDKPDTENNKKRFKDFLKVEITPDIKNIYCFDDAISIDADYMFSFNCNSTTSNKIIKVHGLVIDSLNQDNGFGLQHDFEWWDKKRIAELPKYSWASGGHYYKYYWYDNKIGKAYFFDFEM
jgi:hypothetical protein